MLPGNENAQRNAIMRQASPHFDDRDLLKDVGDDHPVPSGAFKRRLIRLFGLMGLCIAVALLVLLFLILRAGR